MDTYTTRGSGYGYDYSESQQEMKRNSYHNSRENLMEKMNYNDLEKIDSDNIQMNRTTPALSNNTDKQLNLSEKIYNLELHNRNLEAKNAKKSEEIILLKERVQSLTDKLTKMTDQPIVDMKNHAEERRSWKSEKEQLENQLSMMDSMVRSLNEDKLHMREKISVLEINLARPVSYPPTQPHFDYSDPRDAGVGYPFTNPTGHYTYYPSQDLSYPYPSNGSHGYQQSHQAWDPLLTCEICGQKFQRGDIQQARDHLNSQHPK